MRWLRAVFVMGCYKQPLKLEANNKLKNEEHDENKKSSLINCVGADNLLNTSPETWRILFKRIGNIFVSLKKNQSKIVSTFFFHIKLYSKYHYCDHHMNLFHPVAWNDEHSNIWFPKPRWSTIGKLSADHPTFFPRKQ